MHSINASVGKEVGFEPDDGAEVSVMEPESEETEVMVARWTVMRSPW